MSGSSEQINVSFKPLIREFITKPRYAVIFFYSLKMLRALYKKRLARCTVSVTMFIDF